MPKNQQPSDPLHDTLMLLDRLEDLREDMEELSISSLEELRQRIMELEAQLDDGDDDGSV